MRHYKLFLLMLITIGCESNDLNYDSQKFRKYTGKYTIISFKSDIAVDLNKDNIISTELTNEINSFDYRYDLLIKPTNNKSNVKLLGFSFPKTYITFESPGQPEGSVQFLSYGFLTPYQFKDGIFKLKDTTYIEHAYIDKIEADKVVSLNSNLIVVDAHHLKLKLKKEYYDFNTADWIRLNIEVLYKKKSAPNQVNVPTSP